MKECQQIFERLYGSEPDTKVDSKRFSTRRVKDEALRELLHLNELPQAEHIRWKGVFLSSSHPGNGQVLVSPGSSAANPMAGQSYPARVTCIYVREDCIRLGVRKLLPLVDDRWTKLIKHRFPHFPLSFYSCQLSNAVYEIDLEEVEAQYARWDVSPANLSMILDLSKVRSFITNDLVFR